MKFEEIIEGKLLLSCTNWIFFNEISGIFCYLFRGSFSVEVSCREVGIGYGEAGSETGFI